MQGSAPWKTEETIVGLPRLLVLSVFSRFGGCHLSTFHPSRPRLRGQDLSRKHLEAVRSSSGGTSF